MVRYAILAGVVALAALAIFHPVPQPPAVMLRTTPPTAPAYTNEPRSYPQVHRSRSRRLRSRRPRSRSPHRRAARRRRVAPVELNTADARNLARVPGIGASIAQRIVEMRTLEGPYTTLDELLDVAGMNPGRLERASPYLRL